MGADPPWGHRVYSRSQDVVRREVAGETVLVPVAASGAADLEYLYRLNPVGGAVWDALDGRTPLSEIAREIAGVFGPPEDSAPDQNPQEGEVMPPGDALSPQEVEEDIRSFIMDLEEARLAQLVTSPLPEE